ncbi:MAG: type II CRISPR-associated endonuclease Cas1 [Verrucomicrobiota bacterium]
MRTLSIHANNAIIHLRDHCIYVSKWKHPYDSGWEHPVPMISRTMFSQDRHTPIADLEYLILQGRNLSIQHDLISAFSKQHGIVLHLDRRYRPVAQSSPEPRVTDQNLFFAQHTMSDAKQKNLWKQLLRSKTLGQVNVLQSLNISPPKTFHLHISRRRETPPEGALAAQYWHLYFDRLQASNLSRDPASDDPINVALNYGYGVIQAAVHREAIIHGLNPLFGIRHVARAGSHAFVYDLMEPLRHWAEYAVAHNYQKDGVLEMRDFRVKFLEFMETKLGPKGNSRTRFDWVRQHILAVCKGIKSGTPLRELPSA